LLKVHRRLHQGGHNHTERVGGFRLLR
jgi:hypothetical protein